MTEGRGTTSVLVADDHAVVREGIRTLLGRDESIDVVAVAGDGAEALELARAHHPDVVVLDVTMPGMGGLEACRHIKDDPGAAVLILSMHDEPEYVLEAVRAGADGYVLKDAPPMDLRQAVAAVAAGAGYFPPDITERLAAAVQQEGQSKAAAARLARFTPREREVALLIVRGKTSREIADELGIGVRTVETHRQRAMEKAGARTAAALTRLMLEQGIDTPGR